MGEHRAMITYPDLHGPEHPEDKASRERWLVQASAWFDQWLAAHPNALRDLLTTYADDDAHDFLTELRERFTMDMPTGEEE